jgi:membrane protein implicated in regulation of membrane protease activity
VLEALVYLSLVLLASWSLAELIGLALVLPGLSGPPQPLTGPEALPGCRATVLRTTTGTPPLRVRCGSEIWLAEPVPGAAAFSKGQAVRVRDIRGLVLSVEAI